MTENSLFQALEEKAAQLIDSKFDGTLGIVVCDGGFTPFHSLPHFSIHSVDEVISFFLRHNEQISFVLTFVMERDAFQRGAPNQIIPKLYSNSLFRPHESEFLECVNKMLPFLPEVKRDAFNALNHLKGRYPHEGRYKAMQVEEYHGNRTRVRMSARILLELHAGRLTYDEFLERYGFVAVDKLPQLGVNPFESSLNNGALITGVSFHKDETGSDDDIVTITLDGPDVAVSPFAYPPKLTTTIS